MFGCRVIGVRPPALSSDPKTLYFPVIDNATYKYYANVSMGTDCYDREFRGGRIEYEYTLD